MPNKPKLSDTATLEKHEVEVPKKVTGTVRFLTSKAAYTNPAPERLKRILTACRYFAVGCIATVSGSDLFSGYQAKVINFSLAVVIILLGSIELATGVETSAATAKRKSKE